MIAADGVKYYKNTDNLYIKQIRDCTIHIQPIPGFRNSNVAVDNHLLVFDANTISKNIPINEITNIIDDADCGPTTCWLASSPSANSLSYYNTVKVGSELLAPSTDTTMYTQLNMKGSSYSDYTFQMRLNAEEGWGPHDILVTCDSTKQTN